MKALLGDAAAGVSHMRLPLVLMMTLAACHYVGSLESAVPFDTAVADDRLLGEWTTTNEDNLTYHVLVSREERSAYRISYIDGADTTLFLGELRRFGDRLLIDVSPPDDRRELIYSQGGIALHWQAIVTFSGQDARVTPFDADSLEQYFLQNGSRLAYKELRVHYDHLLLLLDESRTLSDSLIRLADQPRLLMEPFVFRRAANPRR